MADIFDGISKLADVFINGRPAEPPPVCKVTIQELVERETSLVRVGKKFYRVTCKEVEIP